MATIFIIFGLYISGFGIFKHTGKASSGGSISITIGSNVSALAEQGAAFISPSGGSGGQTYALSESEFKASEDGLTETLAVSLAESDTLIFELVKGEKHNLFINKIAVSYVELTIASTPTKFILRVGEEAKIDTLSTNDFNVFVKLEEIKTARAKITIKKVFKPKPAEKVMPEVTPPLAGEKEVFGFSLNIAAIVSAAIIVLLIVLAYLILNRKKFGKIKRRQPCV